MINVQKVLEHERRENWPAAMDFFGHIPLVLGPMDYALGAYKLGDSDQPILSCFDRIPVVWGPMDCGLGLLNSTASAALGGTLLQL